MYDLISQMISHNWITTNAGDQQYIYYIAGAMIIVFSAVFIDMVYRIFRHFWR